MVGNYIGQQASSAPEARGQSSGNNSNNNDSTASNTAITANPAQAGAPQATDAAQQQIQTGGLNVSSYSHYNEELGMDEIVVTGTRTPPVYIDDDLMLAQQTMALANRTLSNALRAQAFNENLANKLAHNEARLNAIHDSVPSIRNLPRPFHGPDLDTILASPTLRELYGYVTEQAPVEWYGPEDADSALARLSSYSSARESLMTGGRETHAADILFGTASRALRRDSTLSDAGRDNARLAAGYKLASFETEGLSLLMSAPMPAIPFGALGRSMSAAAMKAQTFSRTVFTAPGRVWDASMIKLGYTATARTELLAQQQMRSLRFAMATRQSGHLGVVPGSGVGSIKNASNPIIVTNKGAALTPELLSRQGTSHLAGNFTGLKGASVEEIFSRVPSTWKVAPQDKGVGIKFLDDAGFERIRIHAPGKNAPAGSNSASGWILRVSDRPGNYFDDLGNLVNKFNNDGHIPILYNPKATQ